MLILDPFPITFREQIGALAEALENGDPKSEKITKINESAKSHANPHMTSHKKVKRKCYVYCSTLMYALRRLRT